MKTTKLGHVNRIVNDILLILPKSVQKKQAFEMRPLKKENPSAVQRGCMRRMLAAGGSIAHGSGAEVAT
jgi:hypothetical protein